MQEVYTPEQNALAQTFRTAPHAHERANIVYPHESIFTSLTYARAEYRSPSQTETPTMLLSRFGLVQGLLKCPNKKRQESRQLIVAFSSLLRPTFEGTR